MSVAKVIEIIAEGKTIEDAVQNGINRAGEKVDEIKSVYLDHIYATTDGTKVTGYRVNAKVTFILKS